MRDDVGFKRGCTPDSQAVHVASYQRLSAQSARETTMPEPVLNDISHRRYNLLRGSWILVSPHRTKRPWQSVLSMFSKSVRTPGLQTDSLSL